MKKIDLGQTISILANAGVIAGIVFLALELRQNNELLVSQSAFAQFNVESQRRLAYIENVNGFVEIALKDGNNEPLTAVEQTRLNLYVNNVLDSWRWQYREFRAGRLPDNYIDLRVWQDVWNATPALRALFYEDESRLDGDFVGFIEREVIGE